MQKKLIKPPLYDREICSEITKQNHVYIYNIYI